MVYALVYHINGYSNDMKGTLRMDELKETFIDINMNSFITLHQQLKEANVEMGFMNNSHSHDFIHVIMNNIFLNDTYYDTSSDEEN